MTGLKIFIFWLILSLSLFSQSGLILQPGTVVQLVDGDKAKAMLKTEDEYTSRLSKFDLQSKTQRTEDVSLSDYLNYSAEQVLKWDNAEKQILGEIVVSTGSKIQALGLKLRMPDTIFVIKSTMDNEGGASGYTRQNYIVLKDNIIGGKSQRLENLFIHELFHVLSRYDSEMSEKVYNSLGFKKTNDVEFPASVKDLKISNPDAPLNNYFMTVSHEGKPADVMLILFAREPYKGGSFFSYLQIGLLAVEHLPGGTVPVNFESGGKVLKVKDVKEFYEQIGKNTDYIFHPEEISADHFVMLLNQEKDLPNPELIEAMRNAMK